MTGALIAWAFVATYLAAIFAVQAWTHRRIGDAWKESAAEWRRRYHEADAQRAAFAALCHRWELRARGGAR